MIITINEDWRLASDPLQWVLQKRYQSKGEEQWRALAFFGNLDRAICELARRHIRCMGGTYGPEALQPLVTNLDQLRDDISAALAGFTTEAAAYHGRAVLHQTRRPRGRGRGCGAERRHPGRAQGSPASRGRGDQDRVRSTEASDSRL